ncbi:MAG: ATP-binding protein [Betaproteobacteria bacterium]|nr:ATP-binding protein [Betaproteobacteria bacterium]
MNAELSARIERLLDRLEPLLPAPREPDWASAIAFRWRRQQSALGRFGALEAVLKIARITLNDIRQADEAKRLVVRNTRHFVEGLPANNVLLTGARGTGKSSLIRACLLEFAAQGLRLIEVDKDDLTDLPDIVARLQGRPERFIVFCDDLSFEQGEPGYKAMKSALDGSIAATGDHVLIYATSNRRHLLPETMRENLEARHQEDGEIHPGDATEEKVSLSERFGLWVAFYPFRQDAYLEVAAHWLAQHGLTLDEAARTAALQFALERGSRSGRVAAQFARDWVGQCADRARHAG